MKKYIDDEISKSLAPAEQVLGPNQSSSTADGRTNSPNSASTSNIGSTSTSNLADTSAEVSTSTEQVRNGASTATSKTPNVACFQPSNETSDPSSSSHSQNVNLSHDSTYTEDVDATFESQPGMPGSEQMQNNPFPNINVELIKTQIMQIQTNMERLVMMVNQPPTIVPPAMKIQAQMQYQALMVQMGNLNSMLFASGNVNGAGPSGSSNDGMMGVGMNGPMNGMGVMTQNGMGLQGQMMNGQNAQYMNQGGMNAGFRQPPVFNNPGHPSSTYRTTPSCNFGVRLLDIASTSC